MSTTLVPYNQAMRLGQVCEIPCSRITKVLTYPEGYNTYLQQICIDRAVTYGQEAIQTSVPSPPKCATPSANSGNDGITLGATFGDTGSPQVCVSLSGREFLPELIKSR